VRGLRRATAFLRAELRATRSLIPLIVLSLLAAFALTRGRVSLAYPAFQSPQSPQSPVTTPTTAPPATATATPAAVPTLTPTETEIPAVPSPGVSTPSAPSVETPPVEPISPTITAETETPTIEPELTPAEGAPPLEPVPIVEEEPARSPGPPWAMFMDTCVVGFSYLWLFCGGIVLMLFVLGAVASFLLRRA
jgi:hypothetical protein